MCRNSSLPSCAPSWLRLEGQLCVLNWELLFQKKKKNCILEKFTPNFEERNQREVQGEVKNMWMMLALLTKAGITHLKSHSNSVRFGIHNKAFLIADDSCRLLVCLYVCLSFVRSQLEAHAAQFPLWRPCHVIWSMGYIQGNLGMTVAELCFKQGHTAACGDHSATETECSSYIYLGTSFWVEACWIQSNLIWSNVSCDQAVTLNRKLFIIHIWLLLSSLFFSSIFPALAKEKHSATSIKLRVSGVWFAASLSRLLRHISLLKAWQHSRYMLVIANVELDFGRSRQWLWEKSIYFVLVSQGSLEHWIFGDVCISHKKDVHSLTLSKTFTRWYRKVRVLRNKTGKSTSPAWLWIVRHLIFSAKLIKVKKNK